MAVIDERPIELGDDVAPRRPLTHRGKVKLVIWSVVVVTLAIVLLTTATSGPAGDQRLINPNPDTSVLVDGVPRAEPAFLGVSNWPLVFSLLFVIVATIVMAPFVWKSWRDRKMHHGLIVFLAVAVLAWLDPPANWVTFTSYDPRFLHFPTTWVWMRWAPSVEPLMVIPGYPFYYFSIALIAMGGYRRYLLPRVGSNSFWWRRPMLGSFIVGFVLAAAWDVPTELFMIRARMYIYSQRVGPVLSVGGSHAGLPIIWSFFTVFSIATITMLLWRDDRGRSLPTTLSRRLPWRHRQGSSPESSARQFVAALLVLSLAYCVPMALYGTLRVSGAADTPYKGDWPYKEIGTYDPYGTLNDAGKPGPFYK